MPPKPRAGRSGRAGGRAGATASRSSTSEAPPAAATQSTDTAPTGEALAQPVVAKHDDDDDENAEPSTTSDPIPVATGTQQTPLVSASALASPQDGTDSPGRPLVQRLGSLDASRSASPALRRGTSTRGKRGAIKPTFTGRRSKEERAALEKEAIEREKARTKEREASDRKKRSDAERKAQRDASRAIRGRGGYSGAMSGPFSLGSSREDRKTLSRTTSGFGAGSGSRATRIKYEGDGGEGSSRNRGSGYGGGGGGGGVGSSVKRQGGGGSESSEDEEDAEFPRRDIDLIEISSDDGDAAPVQRPLRSALPVRIGRREHLDRSLGGNTQATTETSTEILEQSEATGQAPSANVLKQAPSKGKGKAKVTEVLSSKKPFKGVWQDSDELASPLKTEENSEDEHMANAEQIGIVERPEQPTEQREPQPEAESKTKGTIRGITEPVLQTDEDRAEWARFQANMRHVRAELGPDQSATVEVTGEGNMAEAFHDARKATVRDNNVYLFQIPPLMPELLSTAIKAEPTDGSGPLQTPTPAAPVKPEVKIKVEEGFTDAAATGQEAPRFASGLVGKLRVRKSGRTTLDWGGTSYELTPGNKTSFLQEVVSMHVIPERDRVVPEEAGEAVSFGRVKGKFVVVPNWSEMLG